MIYRTNQGNLYRAKFFALKKKNVILTTNKITSSLIKIWYERLGHISYELLKIILKSINITTNKGLYNEKVKFCEVCQIAKYNRHINKTSKHNLQFDIIKRIHSDIGGPLTPTIKKERFYITFLDKKSRYLWIFLLKHKNEAYETFEKLKNQIKNNKNGHIKEFFTD